MGIVVSLDILRSQSTFEYADSATGELTRGQIVGTRAALAEFSSSRLRHRSLAASQS